MVLITCIRREAQMKEIQLYRAHRQCSASKKSSQILGEAAIAAPLDTAAVRLARDAQRLVWPE